MGRGFSRTGVAFVTAVVFLAAPHLMAQPAPARPAPVRPAPARPAPARPAPAEAARPAVSAHQGGAMTEEQAKALEETVAARPDDLGSRTKLLGYYFRRHLQSPAAKAARAKHILWVIENRPESEVAGSPYARLDEVLDGEAYARAKALWLNQVDRHAKDPAVLSNAAQAFLLWDKETARELLERAKALDPKNPDRSRELAQLDRLHARQAGPEARKELAAKALAEQQQAIELSPPGPDRFYLLTDLPETALDAGRPEDAKQFAGRLLEEAARYPKDWNYGNALHKAHVTLGRLALESGDVAAAKAHLIEAGKTPGSPQLNSFGPDFTLAADLFQKGEREAVIEYLQSVRGFWTMGRKSIEGWIKTIEGGGTPDFGPGGRAAAGAD